MMTARDLRPVSARGATYSRLSEAKLVIRRFLGLELAELRLREGQVSTAQPVKRASDFALSHVATFREASYWRGDRISSKSSCRKRRSRSGRRPPPQLHRRRPRRQRPRLPPLRRRSPDTRIPDSRPDSLRRALRQRRRPEVLERLQRRRGRLRHRPDSRRLRERELRHPQGSNWR